MKKYITKNKGAYLLLLILSIPAVLPLLRSGFYEPHDLHHIADIYQMFRGFESGQLPPRFAPDFLYNFGYPLFNFYYLLPFYLGALFVAIGFALTTSFKLVFLTSVLISVVGMYKFLREFVGKHAAIAGSILFLYTPYRAVQIYVRGAMGEAFALSLFPFVLWSIVRVMKRPEKKNVVVFSFVLALFLLAHNYLWLLAAPAILVLIVFLIYSKKDKGVVFRKLMLGGILGAGLTSYWWLPALLENKLVSSVTPFRIEDHFPFIKQLIIPSWGYGSSVWGPGDEISFQIGLINLLAVLVGFVFLLIKKEELKRKKLFPLTVWALGGFFASVLFMNIRTLAIWKMIPFYQFIQFPWRLLIFTTLFSSVVAAVLAEVLSKKFRRSAAAAVVLGAIILTFQYFKPSQVVYKSDDDYLSRMFATRTVEGEKSEVDDEYRNWSEDYLLLPNWTDEKPSSLPESDIEIISGQGEVLKINKISPVNYEAEIDVESPIDLAFNKLYFPGWFAYVDGQKVEIKSHKPLGAIKIVDISRGNHKVEFKWKETNLRKFSDLVSVFALLAAILILTRTKLRKKA